MSREVNLGRRFDVAALRGCAGEKVFARGEAYQRDGRVDILALEPGRLLARVAGNEDYRTELTGQGALIGGHCSCPAFEDAGFCKHIVAAALAANALDGEAEGSGADPLPRICEHLRQKDVEALVAIILDQAERDPALLRKLDLACAVSDEDDETLAARLRRAIDEATRTRGYVDYRRAPAWAGAVNAALDTLAEIAAAGRGSVALHLTERAIDRIEAGIEHLDDSDGHCGPLLERCRDIHLAAARAARPEPVSFASTLFARQMEDEYGTFDGAVSLYADVLGELGFDEYRRLALEAWAKLPPLPASASAGKAYDDSYGRIEGILDFFAERDNDVDARIALRRKDLSSPWRYLQLTEFCKSQGRQDEALGYAEEGLWLFEDRRLDSRLVSLAASLASQAGRKDDAVALLRRSFEKEPSLGLYVQLRELGGLAAGDEAIRFLRLGLTGQNVTRWHRPADLLVQILMREEAHDAAWVIVREHGASPALAEALARASEETHPNEAAGIYAQRAETLVGAGGNAAYAQARDLVARLAGLRSADEQEAYVAALRTRYKAKRNFIKLLG